MKPSIAILPFLFLMTTAHAQSINKTKEEIVSELKVFSQQLIGNDAPNIKNLLNNATFTDGDENGDFDQSMPRYSLTAGEDLVLMVDTDEGSNVVNAMWLRYPKSREYDSDVISMKKALGYLVNNKIMSDKKLKKQYLSLMNSPKDRNGKANYKRIFGYEFMNFSCADKVDCITAEDD